MARTQTLLPIPTILMWLGAAFTVVAFAVLMLQGQVNLSFALVFLMAIFLISNVSKEAAILIALAYLFLMGDIRRIVNYTTGPQAFDTLLLVTPIFATFLALPLLLKVKLRSGVSKAMFFVMVLMILEIFNPRQGGIAVGVSGAIFYLVPILWFWVGRRYGSTALVERILYKVVLPLALAAALLGLCQQFIGFTPWEQAWADSVKSKYVVIALAGGIRPFGFSVSSAEYATLLEIGVVAAIAAWFGRRRAWIMTLPIILPPLVLSSSRGAIVHTVLATAFIWTCRKQKKLQTLTLVSLGFYAVVGLFAVSLLASRFESVGGGGPQTSAQGALARQTEGLAHPLDEKHSSAGVHGGMFVGGLVQGFTYPIGKGLGSLTGAAAKFNTSTDVGSSEVDISDMFIMLGFAGGFVYVYMVFTTFGHMITYARLLPKEIGLPTLGVLAATGGTWLVGGQYSTSALLFFLIGAVTRTIEQSQAVASTQADLARRAAKPTRGPQAGSRPRNPLRPGTAYPRVSGAGAASE